jgi:hypothetical protein
VREDFGRILIWVIIQQLSCQQVDVLLRIFMPEIEIVFYHKLKLKRQLQPSKRQINPHLTHIVELSPSKINHQQIRIDTLNRLHVPSQHELHIQSRRQLVGHDFLQSPAPDVQIVGELVGGLALSAQ